MSLRLVMLRLKRRSAATLVGVTCLVIFFTTMLTICHTPCEHEGKKVVDRSIDSTSKDILVQTNLLITVMSAATHFKERNAIRESWAQELPNGAAVKFVIGNKNLKREVLENIGQELRVHGDLLILDDIEESFSILTKKLLSTLKWVDDHAKFNFLLKVDEDSFVRVENILNELLSKPMARLYWGFFDGRAHVHQHGKWAEKNFVLCDRYLPYAVGGGYVISKDLVNFVARNADMLTLYKNEDVSLGIWLAGLDINRVHEANFDTEYKSRGCYNSYLITHKKSPDELKKLQNNVNTLNKLCEKEHRVRLSYKYNWNVLPTQCCERSDPSVP
ncbi:UDP-Gal betaGal beta 1 [Mactra antiquata]